MVRRLILDSGAIIALARDEATTRAYVALALRDGAPVIVPAPVITETTRGTNADAAVNRVLRQVLGAAGAAAPIDERVARLAGRLLRRLGDTYTGHAPPTIDALIVAVAAARGGGTLLTSDPDDLNALAGDHPEIRVRDCAAR